MVTAIITVALGAVAVAVGLGSVLLALRGQEVPEGILATGAAAIAALAAELRRTPRVPWNRRDAEDQ